MKASPQRYRAYHSESIAGNERFCVQPGGHFSFRDFERIALGRPDIVDGGTDF